MLVSCVNYFGRFVVVSSMKKKSSKQYPRAQQLLTPFHDKIQSHNPKMYRHKKNERRTGKCKEKANLLSIIMCSLNEFKKNMKAIHYSILNSALRIPNSFCCFFACVSCYKLFSYSFERSISYMWNECNYYPYYTFGSICRKDVMFTGFYRGSSKLELVSHCLCTVHTESHAHQSSLIGENLHTFW